jgi:hypothetical protein
VFTLPGHVSAGFALKQVKMDIIEFFVSHEIGGCDPSDIEAFELVLVEMTLRCGRTHDFIYSLKRAKPIPADC